MTPLYETAIARPRATILAGIAVTLAAAPGMMRLHLRTDGHALVPANAPEVRHDAEVRKQFGLDDPIVVLIRTDRREGVFNAPTLSLVVRLTEALVALEGVRPWAVFSLATEHGDRVWPGTLRFRRFLEPFPETREDLERLRDDLRAIKLYTGTLVSRDESATTVMVGVPPGVDRPAFYGRVRAIVDGLGRTPDQLHVIGAPVAEALLGTHIMEDLGVPRGLLGHTTYTEEERSGESPISIHGFRQWIARRVGLLPVAIGIMALTFWFCFRSIAATVLPLLEILAALMFVFGVMGWTGVPVYLTIAVLPIILVVTGVTDEIHIFTRYRYLLRRDATDAERPPGAAGRSRRALLTDAMRALGAPVVKTSLTTAVACLSFAFSPLGAVRAFGVFTAVGVLFCMFWSLTVIPASLALIDARRFLPRSAHGRAPRRSLGARFFPGLVKGVSRGRFVIVVAAIAVVAVAPYGVRRLRVQDSWIDGFSPESEFRQTTEYFNRQFLGTHLLHVIVTADRGATVTGTLPAQRMQSRTVLFPGDLVADPATLVERWVRFRRGDAAATPTPRVNGDSARAARIRRVGREWSAPIEQATRIGDDIVVTFGSRHGSARAALRLYGSDEARFEVYSRPMMSPELLRVLERFEAFLAGRTGDAVGGVFGPSTYIKTTNFMARARKEAQRSIPDKPDQIEWLWAQYERIRGIAHRRQIVSDDYAQSVVSVYLNDANFVDTARLIAATRDYARTELEPRGMTISFAGDVAVSQTLIGAIVTTQVRSLLGSILGIVLITTILGRSLLWGLLCALPCSLAVLLNFAFMGYVDMPLGVATSMFTGMTLGMGIDYAVHFVERYRSTRRRGSSATESLNDAVLVTGPAVFVDAVAVALGFSVLTLSQVPANARLGALVILSLVVCLLASFWLLPAILSIIARRHLKPGDVEV